MGARLRAGIVAVWAVVLAACSSSGSLRGAEEGSRAPAASPSGEAAGAASGGAGGADVAPDGGAAEAGGSGAAGAPDASVDAEPPPPVFEGIWISGKPARSARQAHAGRAGVPQNPGRADDCRSCHLNFAISGTAFLDADGLVPAADAEVGILKPYRNEDPVQRIKVHTDDDGNFWYVDAQSIPAGTRTAARTATSLRTQESVISNGSCNTTSCHGHGATVLRAR